MCVHMCVCVSVRVHACSLRDCFRPCRWRSKISALSFLLVYGTGKDRRLNRVRLSGHSWAFPVTQWNPDTWEGRRRLTNQSSSCGSKDPIHVGDAVPGAGRAVERLGTAAVSHRAPGLSRTADGTVALWALRTPLPVAKLRLRTRASALLLTPMQDWHFRCLGVCPDLLVSPASILC